MADAFAVIGKKGLIDKQAEIIVTGKMRYSADFLPGKKLFGRIKTAPYAHAIIKSIDVSAAEALPGVKAVGTHEKCTTLIGEMPEAYNTTVAMRSFLSQEITWWGQAVAVVVATEPSIAEQALDLINVTYEELDFVLDPDEAMKSSAPLVGCWPDTNIRENAVTERGDVETGMNQADEVIEETIGWTNYFQQTNIETRVATAWWVGDHLYMRVPTPNVANARNVIARWFEIPLSHLHLVTEGTGMIVGDKLAPGGEAAAAAEMSKRLNGQPVCMQYSRREFMLNTQHQHPCKLDVRMGVKNDGTITAIDASFYGQSGGEGSMWSADTAFPFANTIKCNHATFKRYDVATNIPWTGIYRSVQNPPGDFLMEIALDKAADRLGMDPLAFRLKNYTRPEDPMQDNGQPFSSQAVRENIQTVADAIKWNTKWHSPGARTLGDGRLHGVGIAGCVETHSAMGTPVGAIINMTRDGKAITNQGISRVGCGTNSAICAIVAEILGLGYEDVETGGWGNLDVASEAAAQWGSLGLITNGAAFVRAAEDVKAQLLERAAELLGVSTNKLSIGGGKVFVTSQQSKSKTIVELVAPNSYPPIVGRGNGWYRVLQRPLHGWPAGTPCQTRCTCASATEVAIDPETGEVEIIKICNSVDTGRIISRDGVDKQTEAGMDSIAAQALYWEQILDEGTGATLNPNLLDHRWPTSLDINRETAYESWPIESNDAVGPLGAKGIGEPVITTYASLVSAIHNATGKWFTEVPVTPAKILRALGKA